MKKTEARLQSQKAVWYTGRKELYKRLDMKKRRIIIGALACAAILSAGESACIYAEMIPAEPESGGMETEPTDNWETEPVDNWQPESTDNWQPEGADSWQPESTDNWQPEGTDNWQTQVTDNWGTGTNDLYVENSNGYGENFDYSEELDYWEEEHSEENVAGEHREESAGTLHRRSKISLLPEDYKIPGIEEAEKAFELEKVLILPRYMDLDVPMILQKPLLPTGCESVSLTMALQYEEIDIGKDAVAGEYLIYNREDDNMAVGYIGDPYSEEGAGCFAPVIAMTAQEIFLDQELEYDAYDITESELEELLKYVSLGTPVVIWTSMYMEEPEFSGEIGEYEGHIYRWYRQEHCVVLSGYNLDEGTVQINDPLEGIVMRDLEEFKRIYDITGRNAVVLKARDQRTEEEKLQEILAKDEDDRTLQEMLLAEMAAETS